MKKIITVLLILVCSSSMYAQYTPGGLVSQGTLMSTKTEIIRSGFDVWAGGGVGFGVYTGADVVATTYHIDINAGYNVSPRLFFGIGFNSVSSITDATAVYINLRPYISRNLNSLYYNFFLGKVIGGNTIVVNDEDWRNTMFYKPSGMMGGFTIGYVWNHFAFEAGMSLFGGKQIEVNGYDYPGTSFSEVIEDPSLVDWENGYDALETQVLIDGLVRIS